MVSAIAGGSKLGGGIFTMGLRVEDARGQTGYKTSLTNAERIDRIVHPYSIVLFVDISVALLPTAYILP